MDMESIGFQTLAGKGGGGKQILNLKGVIRIPFSIS
jgi:CO dehydrogenase/acetyl-CoA synthase beta subunit